MKEISVILKKDRDHLKILGKESSTELFEFFADSDLHLKNEALEKYTGKCIEYICDICKKAPRETFHLKLQGRINEILNAICIQINNKVWKVMMSTDGHFFMMCDKMPLNAGLSADDQVATTFAFKLACFECMMKEFREDEFPLIIDFYHCFNQKEKDLIRYIADEYKMDKILENQQIIKMPVVRNGKQSTLGYQPDVWKKWD